MMDTVILKIKGFKCFLDESFELNDLTILTGANASGKSSVIQSLLLLRLATISRNITIDNGIQKNQVGFDDKRYALDLGTIDNLYNEDTDGSMEFYLNDDIFSTSLDDVVDGDMGAKFIVPKIPSSILHNFFYLSAEREGPRYQSENKMSEGDGCGCNGQYTATVMAENDACEVHKSRWKDSKIEGKLRAQLDNWLDYIFPGISVRSVADGANHYEIRPRANWLGKEYAAPNIGFGISYALPIIVNGLLIPQGGTLIVESPEAHLHAKAQSNMGYFLAKVASSGVRVIVETHSEHIVNGVRRFLLSEKVLAPENVNTYFLQSTPKGIQKTLIKIDNEGNLSDFPLDFFDQARQDLYAMCKLLDSN